MNGLPHYRNDRIGMALWEPVYLNLFQVLLTPPPAVDTWDYVIDNVTKISGLTTDLIPTAPVEQTYKGSKRSYAGAFPEKTTVDLAMSFQVNLNDSHSMFVFKGLRQWCDLIFDPLNGAMVLKKDYVGGPLVVSLYNRRGDIFRQWTFPVLFPMSPLPAMDLDYAATDIWQIEMTFRSDYWDDVAV